jgi:hypothetical protein
MKLDEKSREAFDAALPVIAAFKRTFGRDISPDFIAELYAARELNLELAHRQNEPGADGVDAGGRRYEIKYRNEATHSVDVNGFDFDELLLVNLDREYQLIGIWSLGVDQAKSLFVFRERFRKYQATQANVKRAGKKIR